MIITFCGHRDFVATPALEQKLLSVFKEQLHDSPADLYLGGYGNFDGFALRCGHIYKTQHPQISLIYVSPYITPTQANGAISREASRYDQILYPGLERVPPRYAILYRNRYMAEQADLVIAYITRSRGGAYQMYQYAKRKGKIIYNLADMD